MTSDNSTLASLTLTWVDRTWWGTWRGWGGWWRRSALHWWRSARTRTQCTPSTGWSSTPCTSPVMKRASADFCTNPLVSLCEFSNSRHFIVSIVMNFAKCSASCVNIAKHWLKNKSLCSSQRGKRLWSHRNHTNPEIGNSTLAGGSSIFAKLLCFPPEVQVLQGHGGVFCPIYSS